MTSVPPRLVVVTTTAGLGQAAIWVGTLQAAGIPAVTSQEGAGAAFGFTVGPLGLVDILVPEDRASEAEALLAELRGDDPDNEPAEDADSPQ
jgi:hypothetical protein